MVRFPKTIPLINLLRLSQSYNPIKAYTLMVWAPPRSLAATCGIIFIFSSSTYLDVSVRWVSLQQDNLFRLGCPIRISADLRSFAPPHGFSQLITSFFASESQGIPRTPFVTSTCAYFFALVLFLLYLLQYVIELLLTLRLARKL